MTNIALIKLMNGFSKKYKKRLFTLREIADYTGESLPSVGMTLLRARKAGLVERVENIWFNMLEAPSVEEMALALRLPSYISFESALYHHGVLSQSPKGGLTVAVLSKPKELKTPLGDIRYMHLSKKLFFGFDAERIACPEKAFLDLIYINKKHGIHGFSEVFYTDLMGRKKLRDLAKHFPAFVNREILDQRF